ncbi:cobalt ABC transporter ATP-binding protein [Sporomusaceae bacterium FL31]|nr:cobalt ABC transporter ATP-binding protein [Sporomusaceae bacterium FL31]GCE32969.1 cobalt ABC transporter ATP-binding protein [Sporomusaceae bacterium]
MLELQSVDFGYKAQTKAISNVSLVINPGEFLAIAGRNGSGKTTLTRLLMALKKPTAGDILLQGQSIKKFSPADMARHIGYVFQNPDRQIFRDTVQAEVSYGPEQLGYTPEHIQQYVQEALAVTGLTELAATYPSILSRGQKQRLAIASALAMQPAMLILDEPTSGQDAQECQQLLILLAKLHQQGKTIVLITHDMEILARYAERVIVMDHGHKVFDGLAAALFQDDRLTQWGLSAPVAHKISRALASLSIKQTCTIQPLISQLSQRLRRDDHANASSIN